MPTILQEPSRTFSEFLLLPNLTTRDLNASQVSLRTPLVRHHRAAQPALSLNIPLVSAVMQAVSDDRLAIALARCGGMSFIYQSQPIAEQAAMVQRVKRFKAGFVESDSNLQPTDTLGDALDLAAKTGHTTVAVTEDGTATGRLLGLISKRHYRLDRNDRDEPLAQLMTPVDDLICGRHGAPLEEAGDLIWKHHLDCLPIIDNGRRLRHLVFRRDFDASRAHPLELVDAENRLRVGAGVNTRDYRERVPQLLEAGADLLCLDSSDGYSEWQRDALAFVRERYGDAVCIGAGNVVDAEGFRYLVEHGADFVKVGIGGGSICITREQKGIGRGQASAVIDVARARDAYFAETGIYVPICSDGGISQDYHILIALALGADFVMMGRYFARFDESPGKKKTIGNRLVKEYWAEGSNRAKNWQRYDLGGDEGLSFEEGVDSYVPYAGHLDGNVQLTMLKVRSTMTNCGADSLATLRRNARLTIVSQTSIVEGGAHSVIPKTNED